MAVVVALILGACTRRPPVSPVLDAASIELDAVSLRMAELDGTDCHVLAWRAHEAVLALEASARPAETLPRYRLHALAATLGECAGIDRPPFYGSVAGRVVDLHDLRNAQLLHAEPALPERDVGPVAEGRVENVRFYVQLVAGDARFADADAVLALLGKP